MALWQTNYVCREGKIRNYNEKFVKWDIILNNGMRQLDILEIPEVQMMNQMTKISSEPYSKSRFGSLMVDSDVEINCMYS